MFAYVRDKLAYVPSFDEWTKETHGGIVLNFSLSPLGYIKLIVEHLLILPQVLEPYDQHEALGRISVADLRSVGPSFAVPVDADVDDGDSGHGSSSGFASQWINEVCRATQTLFLAKIFEIPRLNNYGASQLAIDINHLFSVLGVLGIAPLRAMSVVQQSLKSSEAQFPALLTTFTKDTDIGIANRIKALRKF